MRKRSDGFSEAQRKWIIARDNGKCVLCGSSESLHVHHISPWRWSVTVLRWSLERTNSFLNAVALCKICHVSGENAIHPDIFRANSLYKDNKNAYKDVFAERDNLCRRQMPYWCIAYDEKMFLIAAYNSTVYISQGNFPNPWQKEIDRFLEDQSQLTN